NGTPDLTSVPAPDQPILARALSKSPDDRWVSCAELIQRLRQAGARRVAASAVRQFIGQPHAPNEASPPAGQPLAGQPALDEARESGQPTRMAPGGGGRFPPDPPESPGRTPTPSPNGLPPLVSPNGSWPGTSSAGSAGALAQRLITPSAASTGNQALTLVRPNVF